MAKPKEKTIKETKTKTPKQSTKAIKGVNNLQVEYLEETARDLLNTAKEKGLNKNFVFTTTFNRYLTQITLLNKLIEDFSKCESLVVKEYVKGRETITAHPLILRINTTIDSANKTANLLVKILTKKELEVKEEIYSINDLDFMTNNDIISKLGTYQEQLKADSQKLNHREIEEMADKIKERYIKKHYGKLEKYTHHDEFKL